MTRRPRHTLRKVAAKYRSRALPVLVVAVLALAGLALLAAGSAATHVIVAEAENGTPVGQAKREDIGGASAGAGVKFGTAAAGGGTSTTPNFKVAFMGDQGITSNAKAVLNLVKRQNAALIVHLGDFDYENDPAAWESQTNSVLGGSWPQLAVIGNHDENVSGYQAQIAKRTPPAPATCTGSRAARAICKVNGLVVIEEGMPYTSSKDNATDVAFIRDTLVANRSSMWKICAWHAQTDTLQVGEKGNETGYNGFEECRKEGAIVFTGHEHSYHRTKTLTSFTSQTVDSSCNSTSYVCVGPGRSFTAVSGLAGVGIRGQERCMPTTPPYGCKGEWAKIYTTDQGAKYGALFVTFNINGNPKLAKGEFINISNEVVDSFEIRRD